MSNTITVTRAHIRCENSLTKIDAIVNGEWNESWVLFSGDTNAHVDAAFTYLTEQLGLHCDHITFEDEVDDDDLFRAESNACGYYS